jgi:fucose permease
MAVGFIFSASLQEITDEMMSNEFNHPTKPLLKQKHFIGRVLAQWLYVCLQVTVTTFFINLANEDGIQSDSKES